MARGHIRRRGEASWEIKYAAPVVNGRYRTLTKTVRGTKDDARRKLTELLRQQDTGSAVDPSKTTVGQYLDVWLAEIQVEPKTLERYSGIVECQVKRSPIGSAILQELRPQAIKSWHKWLREKGARVARLFHPGHVCMLTGC